MAKCNLSISLDKTTYKGGDTLHGILHVDVDETCQCNGLLINTNWKTTGMGDSDSKTTKELTLFQGEWQPNQYHYPFEFVLPQAPLSYDGRYINIIWHLQASADIPWAINPSCKYGFNLQPGDNPKQRKQAALLENNKPEHTLIQLKKLLPVLAGILFFSGLIIMLAEQEYVLGSILWGASLIALYFSMQTRIAEFKTGKVKHSLSEWLLNPGDTLRCNVSFTPRSRVNINSITATLIGREYCENGTGKQKETYKHRFYEKQFTLMESRQTEADMHVSSKVNIDIPEGIPSSYTHMYNHVIWEIEIRVDVDTWPDWVKLEPITIIA